MYIVFWSNLHSNLSPPVSFLHPHHFFFPTASAPWLSSNLLAICAWVWIINGAFPRASIPEELTLPPPINRSSAKRGTSWAPPKSILTLWLILILYMSYPCSHRHCECVCAIQLSYLERQFHCWCPQPLAFTVFLSSLPWRLWALWGGLFTRLCKCNIFGSLKVMMWYF